MAVAYTANKCEYRRLVHHILPHEVHLTCLPLLQDRATGAALTPPLTPSCRLDVHRSPSLQAPPSHPRKSRLSIHTNTTLGPTNTSARHSARGGHENQQFHVSGAPRKTDSDGPKEKRQAFETGLSLSLPHTPLPLHHPVFFHIILIPRPTAQHPTPYPEDQASPHHVRQALCVRRTPIPTD